MAILKVTSLVTMHTISFNCQVVAHQAALQLHMVEALLLAFYAKSLYTWTLVLIWSLPPLGTPASLSAVALSVFGAVWCPACGGGWYPG